MAKGAHCKGGAIMRMIWDRVGGKEGRKDLLHRYYRTEGVCFSTRHWHLAICFKGCTNRGTQIVGGGGSHSIGHVAELVMGICK